MDAVTKRLLRVEPDQNILDLRRSSQKRLANFKVKRSKIMSREYSNNLSAMLNYGEKMAEMESSNQPSGKGILKNVSDIVFSKANSEKQPIKRQSETVEEEKKSSLKLVENSAPDCTKLNLCLAAKKVMVIHGTLMMTSTG